jgi:hypothetical protein
MPSKPKGKGKPKEAKTPAAESVAQIKAKAATRKPDANRFRRAARYADAAMQSDRYELSRSKSSVDGLKIHYFRVEGESVTGILAEPERELWKGVTYRLVQDDGTVVRLPGNKRLTKAIEKADAIYQRVKITYHGKLYTRFGGHYEKVYTLEAAPLDHDLGPKGRELLGKAAADAKARKAAAK